MLDRKQSVDVTGSHFLWCYFRNQGIPLIKWRNFDFWAEKFKFKLDKKTTFIEFSVVDVWKDFPLLSLCSPKIDKFVKSPLIVESFVWVFGRRSQAGSFEEISVWRSRNFIILNIFGVFRVSGFPHNKENWQLCIVIILQKTNAADEHLDGRSGGENCRRISIWIWIFIKNSVFFATFKLSAYRRKE